MRDLDMLERLNRMDRHWIPDSRVYDVVYRASLRWRNYLPADAVDNATGLLCIMALAWALIEVAK